MAQPVATPAEIAAEVARSLGAVLTPFQDALHYLTAGGQLDVQRRLLILFSLAEPEHRSVDAMTEELKITIHDLRRLARQGLVKISHRQVFLTMRGESLVALLFMMNKQVNSGTSEGMLDLIGAAQGGGYGSEFIARLVIGSTWRLAERLKQSTVTEEIDHLEKHSPERQAAWARVEKAIELLNTTLAEDTLKDLRSASAELAKVSSNQTNVVTRIKSEDVPLPTGVLYSDMVRVLSAHSEESITRLLVDRPILKHRLYRPPRKFIFREDIKHAFAPRAITETTAEATLPKPGIAWEDEALSEFSATLEVAPNGAIWHDLAQGPRGYLRGVWYALQGRLPKRLREQGIRLTLTGERLHDPPHIDTPIIRVERST